MANKYVSLSIPVGLSADLKAASAKAGLSQSAFLAVLIRQVTLHGLTVNLVPKPEPVVLATDDDWDNMPAEAISALFDED